MPRVIDKPPPVKGMTVALGALGVDVGVVELGPKLST